MPTSSPDRGSEAALLAEETFPAEESLLPRITAFALEAAGRAGLSPARRPHLELAVEEVFVNICRYAYQRPSGQVSLRLEETREAVRLTFIDRGRPFDPLDREAPDLAAGVGERPVGGLGLFLVMRLMKETVYRRDGDLNILRLELAKT
jgi:anti-sigma regulatory factor (Ser/Thr protein kinase)